MSAVKATERDAKVGNWLYVKVHGEFHKVRVVEIRKGTKGLKVVYETESGERGSQQLVALYRNI